jgi:hypothetical protein
LPQVHAENGDAVALWQKRIFEMGVTGPEGHALSRPPSLEGEATGRAIRLAGLANVPLYVVHVMSIDALEEVGVRRGAACVGGVVASAWWPMARLDGAVGGAASALPSRRAAQQQQLGPRSQAAWPRGPLPACPPACRAGGARPAARPARVRGARRLWAGC